MNENPSHSRHFGEQSRLKDAQTGLENTHFLFRCTETPGFSVKTASFNYN